MKKLYVLLFVACLAVSAVAQKSPTLGIATHHLNFDSWGNGNWQNNWGPTKLMVGIPLTEQLYAYPNASMGTGNYADLPKDRLFWNLDGNIKYDFTKTRIQPYILGGLGVTKVQFDNYKRDFYFGPNVGLGLNIWLNEAIGINAQTQYYVLPGFHNYHQAALGIVFKLNSQPADADKDGVPDETDACPNEPGTLNGCPDQDGDGVKDADDACPTEAGIVALNGCPDQDGDGIADNNDKCPTQAGKAELNGCPDQDGDGIADADDQCPTVAGPKNLNGCPDTDGDGVLDKNDKCPNEKGIASLNGCPDQDGDGFADKDDKCPTEAGVARLNGCPEIKQEEVKKIEEELNVAATHILFDTGKETIKAKSYADLDKIAAIMNQYTYTKFNIEGHTDNVGNADRNKALSQSRADEVKKYLVSKGLSESRLTSIGYGQERPIADNKTAAGKTKNRRVEIHLVQ